MQNSSTLDNQLRVVTESVPGSRSVAIGILVAAGPQDEQDDKAGLAHLTEHGFFLGTSGRNSREISQLVDETCGQVGAFTSRDYTCFYAHIMHDYRPFAWDLLGDMILNSTFPEERILQEREVVLQELGISHDRPRTRLNDVLKRSIWPKHPLGRPVGGDPDSVSSLTREDVIYFVGQNYMPDRMIIAAVGDIDHEATVAEARDSFWRLLGTSPPAEPPPCDFESAVLMQNCDVSHSYFSIAFPGRPYNSANRYGLHALDTLLGGGMSSRLYTQLRESMGLVYDVSSSYDAYNAAGVLMVEGVTSSENLGQVVSIVMQQVAEIAQDGIDEEELHRIKLQIRGRHQLASDSIHTRMSRLLTQEFYGRSTVEEEAVLSAVDDLTRDDVQREAQQVLDPEKRAIATIGPGNDGMSTEELTEILFQDFSSTAVL